MDEYKIAIHNLEALRNYFGFHKNEIDSLLNFSEGKYARIIKEQSLELKDLISVSSLYNLKTVNILNPNLKMPSLKSLPEHVLSIAKDRMGKPVRTQEKRDLTPHLIIILSKYFKVNDSFTNSKIKTYLPSDIQNKSIEWRKTKIKDYVVATDKKEKVKTKPEIVYKLVKAIPANVVEEATRVVSEG